MFLPKNGNLTYKGTLTIFTKHGAPVDEAAQILPDHSPSFLSV
jgi:hypothetical protein